MIVVYHQNNKVVAVEREEINVDFSGSNIPKVLFAIAEEYPDELLIWCDINFKSNLNLSRVQTIFHHRKIMASYNPFENSFLPKAIGYIEESPFIEINKKTSYPTWQMSSCVGGIFTSVLLTLKEDVKGTNNFYYFLHSVARLAMPKGLFCYSEPELLKGFLSLNQKNKKRIYILFRFVKQHYKTRWVFLLFLNLFLYERKIAFLPLVFSLFYSDRKLTNNLLASIQIQSTKKVIDDKTIDVIIPTIGRKNYLYDVLKDFAQQTYLPKNIIIVEQNPNLESKSELDYLTSESWPFAIKHIFIHQAGACNARNLALAEVTSEWVFMADDDIRFEGNFIENVWDHIKQTSCEQITLGCYGIDYPDEKKEKKSMQWVSFGSGCSVVKAENIRKINYDIKYEFGYGEDADFGMQMRHSGHDVIYFSKPEILHLQAPIGGFRTKPVLAWHNEKVQPKPSPTVMLYKQKYATSQQLSGYKTLLFLKFYSNQKIKNPIRYYTNFQKQWKQSVVWANYLKNS